MVVVTVPGGVGDGEGASVVAAGSGVVLEIVGAGIMIVVSEAGIGEGLGSTEDD